MTEVVETVVETKGKKVSTKLDMSSFKGDKVAALQAGLAKIKKDFGGEAIAFYGDKPTKAIAVTPTGSIGLDIVLGVGGYPRGRIIEIYGPEASGKTTMMLHAIAQVQKAGGICAFIDAEHALDPKYAAALGVDMPSLLLSQPDNGEEALGIAETLTSTGAVDMIVIDSVAALVPKAELEADMGASLPGIQARLMSQGLRKLTALANVSKTTIFFINQLRDKIGVMFGSPETTTGGKALKFYASQRLDIRRIGALKQGEEQVGCRTRVKVVKNKVAPPAKEVEFDIRFGKGINTAGELIDLGTELNLVEKAGAWYSYLGERIGQGRDNAVAYLESHDDMRQLLDTAIRKHYDLPVTTESHDDTRQLLDAAIRVTEVPKVVEKKAKSA